MNQKINKEKHQKVKTEIITNPAKFLPTIVLAPKVIETYSSPNIVYGYNPKNQYYPTTQSNNTTKTNNNYYDYPSSGYYSSGQYENYNFEDSTTKYSSKTYNYRHINEDNQERNTFPNYEYQNIKETKGKNQRSSYENFQQNMIYIERNTNYPQSNVLNLNNFYDMNDPNNNKRKTTINANANINNVKQEYKEEYYNNNMYIVQSGSSGKQKITQNIIPNNIYYNEYNSYNTFSNDQQGIKVNENIINNKKEIKGNMIYNNENNKQNIYSNENIKYMINNTQEKINKNRDVNNANPNTNKNIKNPSNLYMNSKIIIDKKENEGKYNKNYSEYSPMEKNNLINNSGILNSLDYKVLVEEPSDNMRKRGKKDLDQFNNTMPSLKINNDISKNPTLNTIQRKTYPIQAISGFEITFNNTSANLTKNNMPQEIKNINSKKKNKNYIPITINNISLTNNSKGNINDNGNNKINGKANLIEVKEDLKEKIENNIENNDKNVNKEDKIDEIQKNINAVKYFDTYTGKIEYSQNQESINSDKSNNKKEEKEKPNKKSGKKEGVDIKKLREEFDLLNNNQYFNISYPIQNDNIYNINNNINNNINQNINQRNNRFENLPKYAEINLNLNTDNNINSNNIDNVQQKKQQKIINIVKEVKTEEKGENTIKVIEPQKPKKRRPVFKIPPSKKRAISQGKALTFIHKYYDENFILEEDNEDIGSDNENKKNKLKSIFKKVTNIRKIIPQPKEYKEEMENINIDKENENNNNNLNNEGNENIDIKKSLKNMRLSHIRFSLESSNSPEDTNSTINIINNKNEDEETSDNQKDIVNMGSDMENKDINKNTENNQNNNNLNCEMKSTIVSKVQFQSKNISDNIIKEKLSDSNISDPRNSDSIIEHKNSFNDFVERKDIYVNENILNSDIYKEENININNEIDMNLNIENEKQNENDDKRISLNIEGHDLDKYFEEEGVNKRNKEQKEISDSLRTINLEENYKNSQIMSENEEQNDNLGNSNISNVSNKEDNIKRGDSEEELITIDEALKGSVHIPGNIQDFVKKNNEMYKDSK